MRKFYNEYFYVPKHTKIREKVMLTRVITSVAVVVFSLLAMSFSAYAYFSHDVTSGFNTIKAATFQTKIEVQIIDEEGAVAEKITPITSNYKIFKVSGLKAGKTYTVRITPTKQSSATTGFVTVTATGSDKTYHTQQLGIDENVKGGKTKEMIFKLLVTDTTDIVFEAHWGTSAYYPKSKDSKRKEELYITQNEEIKIIINGITEHTEENVTDTENTPEY